MAAPSDLEMATLGLIWRYGPCTPYFLRQQLLQSPTAEWSGSAGTIYPLVRRLEDRGLLRSKADEDDGRNSRLYRVTASGRRALAEWLQPPLPERAVSTAADPVRTRAFFLDVLEAEDQIAFLDRAAEQTREHLQLLKAKGKELGDEAGPVAGMAARGAVLQAQARLRWLAEIRAELE